MRANESHTVALSPPADDYHPFITAPHKTLISLSLPVLLSLIAEPVTGLVDTAFIARMGATPLAALGVGAMTLSSFFWAFNFLNIGTQTEVAHSTGSGNTNRVRRMAGSAVLMGLVLGIILGGVIQPLTPALAKLMGAENRVQTLAVAYIRIRLFGAPAVLITIAAFGVLRGRQDMRTPMWITAAINLLNVVLDPIMIFGLGPFPSLGIGGAAWASVISQWIGAGLLLVILSRRIGWARGFRPGDFVDLLTIGGDLFVRTGMLTLFLLLATRAATRRGPAEGAAHQAIRQVWVLTAMLLDAYAVAGQSLVAYFAGARQLRHAVGVARVVCIWSLLTGIILALCMWLGRGLVITLLVPPAAAAVFLPAWYAMLAAQPVNALAFATDGILWGMGDFRFLRNVVLGATALGTLLLWGLGHREGFALDWIWGITGVWILIRAGAGILRIWPGCGASPIRGKGRLDKR